MTDLCKCGQRAMDDSDKCQECYFKPKQEQPTKEELSTNWPEVVDKRNQ
jgi:hypothetical protein